jgi:hypothetical protein
VAELKSELMCVGVYLGGNTQTISETVDEVDSQVATQVLYGCKDLSMNDRI